jgi:hypothetical protein
VGLGLPVELYLIVALMINVKMVISMDKKKALKLILNVKMLVLINMTAMITAIGWVAREEGMMPFHQCCSQ